MHPQRRDIAERSCGGISRPRSLRRRRAAVQASAGDPREGARSRPSRRRESLNNLAELYQDQGRYADAEPLLQASAGDLGEGARSRTIPTSRRR